MSYGEEDTYIGLSHHLCRTTRRTPPTFPHTSTPVYEYISVYMYIYVSFPHTSTPICVYRYIYCHPYMCMYVYILTDMYT
jgi:hypothetical protein